MFSTFDRTKSKKNKATKLVIRQVHLLKWCIKFEN